MTELDLALTHLIVYFLSIAVSYTGVWGWVLEDERNSMTIPERIFVYLPVLNSLGAICVFCDWLQIWIAQKLFPKDGRVHELYSRDQ